VGGVPRPSIERYGRGPGAYELVALTAFARMRLQMMRKPVFRFCAVLAAALLSASSGTAHTAQPSAELKSLDHLGWGSSPERATTLIPPRSGPGTWCVSRRTAQPIVPSRPPGASEPESGGNISTASRSRKRPAV